MGIGERIREKRKEMKLTAKELSERSGVPEKTIYRIETNEVADPKVSSLKPIIEVLGCSADEIIMDSKNSGLSGMLKYQFERSEDLPVRKKAILIEFISGWINNANTEKMYLSTLSNPDRQTHEFIKEMEDEKFDELVNNALEIEKMEESTIYNTIPKNK